jgi:hypothetical protein
MLGVAMGRRNFALPLVMRYCGPAAKLVSCAEQTLATRSGISKSANRNRREKRIRPPRKDFMPFFCAQNDRALNASPYSDLHSTDKAAQEP